MFLTDDTVAIHRCVSWQIVCVFLFAFGLLLALCLSASLFFGETQIWLGDLRVVLVVLCCFLVVMICRVHVTNSCPCTSMNSLFSGKDRASERQGPNSREKKSGTTAFQATVFN